MAPTSVGAIFATVRVASDATNSPVSVSVSGLGQAALASLTPDTSSDFGLVTVGSSASRTFTFSVSGNKAASGLTASVNDPKLSISANSCSGSVQPGSSCSVTVSFAPSNGTALSGAALSVSSSALGSPTTLALSGQGANASAMYIPFDTDMTDALSGATGTFQNIFGSGTTGTGVVSTAQSAAGGGSLLLTASGTGTTLIGNTGGVVFPPNTELAVGTGDFTLEVKANRVAANIYSVSDYSGALLAVKNAGGRMQLAVDDAGAKYGSVPYIVMGGNGYYAVDFKVPLGAWNTYTLTRRNGQVQLRINGVLQTLYAATFDSNSEMATATSLGTSVTNTLNISGTTQLVVGNQAGVSGDAGRMWRGYIDEVRAYRNDISAP